MHVVSWETNKTRFSKYILPQIGENQNCPTWVRFPLLELFGRFTTVCTVYYSALKYILIWDS